MLWKPRPSRSVRGPAQRRLAERGLHVGLLGLEGRADQGPATQPNLSEISVGGLVCGWSHSRGLYLTGKSTCRSAPGRRPEASHGLSVLNKANWAKFCQADTLDCLVCCTFPVSSCHHDIQWPVAQLHGQSSWESLVPSATVRRLQTLATLSNPWLLTSWNGWPQRGLGGKQRRASPVIDATLVSLTRWVNCLFVLY
jgi:hypothetical protein